MLHTVQPMTVIKILVMNNVFFLIGCVGDLLSKDSLIPFITSFHNNLEGFNHLQISVKLICLSQEKKINNK